MADESLEVADAGVMDDRTFIKHMNVRHQPHLGGLNSLWKSDDTTMAAWRRYHEFLHGRINPNGGDILHTHAALCGALVGIGAILMAVFGPRMSPAS